MADRKWKIFETKGNGVGGDLKGLLLEETATGFEIKDPEKQILASTFGMMPTLPFDFHDFDYAGNKWKIEVTGLELGKGGHDAEGRWTRFGGVSPDDDDGTWTAQAGGHDEGAEEDVASAKA